MTDITQEDFEKYFRYRPIGFFDSGVGGLSVLARFRKELPNEDVIYFGDTANLPYGEKTKEELIGYAHKIFSFMDTKGAKAVVIACNTSSAQAYDSIVSSFKGDFQVHYIYPIIQCCAKSVSELNVRRVGVFATEATVKSGKYTSELKKYNPKLQVKEMAAKNWVNIVEGKAENREDCIKNIRFEIEEMMAFKPDKIILGCTHYPYLTSELTKYAPEDIFIDPAEIFVKYIKEDMIKEGILNNQKRSGKEEIFVSADPEAFVKNAKTFYDIKELPSLV